YTYRATSNLTTLTFAFRQDPSYWCLDDISVMKYNTSNGSDLISNGGFERGSTINYTLCTPRGSSVSGTVSTRCPRSGNYSYIDGSYAPGDFLSQTFSTIPQHQYQIRFWLSNLGASPNSINVTISSTIVSDTAVLQITTQQPAGSGLTTQATDTNCTTPSTINSTTLLSLNNSSASNYTNYQCTYRATSNQTILMFALRQDPNYWCLDDILVTTNNSNNTNLLINGDFETGNLQGYSMCNPISRITSGIVVTNQPHSGTYNLFDGSYLNPDYLWQIFSTQQQQQYQISFWLLNSGSSPSSITVTIGPYINLKAMAIKTSSTNSPVTTQQFTTRASLSTSSRTNLTTIQPNTSANNGITTATQTSLKINLTTIADQRVTQVSTGTSKLITTTSKTTNTTYSTSCTIPSWKGNNNDTILLLSLIDSPPFNYTYYQYTYRATSNLTTLTFAFRQDPSYWCLDDISVIMSNSSNNVNIISNGGFESGSLENYTICNPSGTQPSGRSTQTYAYSGNYSYVDGSYASGDYLTQTFITVRQKQYRIGFWLKNSGYSPNSVNVTISPFNAFASTSRVMTVTSMINQMTTNVCRGLLVTFDNVPNYIEPYLPIPDGYSNLNWTNVYVLNATTSLYNTSGYYTALSSGKFVAFNAYGNPMSIYRTNGVFNVTSFVASAVLPDNLQLTLIGRRSSTVIYRINVTLRISTAFVIVLNWLSIDNMTFQMSSSSYLAIDNLCLSTVFSDILSTSASTTSPRNSLPSQCSTYNIINDSTRSVNYVGTGGACDSSIFNSTPIWVRFIGSGGTKLPTSPPNIYHCGTDAPGWVNSVYPSISASTTYSAKVCYYWNNDTCKWSNLIQITSCYTFYVFQLIAPSTCNLRYCITT
ncbi:unnamed protein product, partial [Didymodactylos carnosus]